MEERRGKLGAGAGRMTQGWKTGGGWGMQGRRLEKKDGGCWRLKDMNDFQGQGLEATPRNWLQPTSIFKLPTLPSQESYAIYHFLNTGITIDWDFPGGSLVKVPRF